MQRNPDFLLKEHRVGEARKALEKLQRRAARHGLTQALYTIGDVGQWIEHSYRDAFDRTRVWHELKIPVWIDGGEPVRVAGWDFIARLENLGEDTMVHVVPGCEAVVWDMWREQDETRGRCDHCNTARARRHQYVVRDSDTGAQKCIGSTCLRDFLGCDTPASIMRRFEFEKLMRDAVDEDEDLPNDRPFGEWDVPTDELLTATCTAIRMFGWMSRSRCNFDKGEQPTSSLISDFFWGSSEDAIKLRREMKAQHTDADEEQARAVREYWRADAGFMNQGEDYVRNLHILSKQDITLQKHFSLLCSAVSSWARAKGITLGPQAQKKAFVERRWADDKVRIKKMPVRVASVIHYTSQWTESGKVVKFVAEDGSEGVWMTSGYLDFGEGADVLLTATVKGFNEYKGKRQNQLSRCVMEAANG